MVNVPFGAAVTSFPQTFIVAQLPLVKVPLTVIWFGLQFQVKFDTSVFRISGPFIESQVYPVFVAVIMLHDVFSTTEILKFPFQSAVVFAPHTFIEAEAPFTQKLPLTL